MTRRLQPLNDREHAALAQLIKDAEEILHKVTAIAGAAYGAQFMDRCIKVGMKVKMLRYALSNKANDARYLYQQHPPLPHADELRAEINLSDT
jgi:hypothetical protein